MLLWGELSWCRCSQVDFRLETETSLCQEQLVVAFTHTEPKQQRGERERFSVKVERRNISNIRKTFLSLHSLLYY